MKITWHDLREIIGFLNQIAAIQPTFDGYRLDIINARIHGALMQRLNMKLKQWYISHGKKQKMAVSKWSTEEKASFLAVYKLVGSTSIPVMTLAGELDKEIL